MKETKKISKYFKMKTENENIKNKKNMYNEIKKNIRIKSNNARLN